MSNQELKKLCEASMFSTPSQLISGTYRPREIQLRANELNRLIEDLYGRPANMLFSYDGVNKDSTTLMSPSLSCGKPSIYFFVPACVNVFQWVEEYYPYSFTQLFETIIAVGWLHELNYLVFGNISWDNKDHEKIIFAQSIAWAHTCEKTLRVFSEVYERELIGTHKFFYDIWVQCNRNEQSLKWKNAIISRYGNVKKG